MNAPTPPPLEAVVADLARRLAALEAALADLAAERAGRQVEANVRALIALGYPEKVARRMAAGQDAAATL